MIMILHGRIESQGFIERFGIKKILRVIGEGEGLMLIVTVMATSKFESMEFHHEN